MCYKSPGPRCSSHAASTLAHAKQMQRDYYNNTRARIANTLTIDEVKAAIKKAQDDYDATPAGILELERRTNQSSARPEEVDRLALGILRRKEALAAIGVKDKGDHGRHSSEIQELTEPTISRDFMREDVLRQGFREETAALPAKVLMKASEAWVNRLSPEETEAVAWMTSNGFSVMRAHVDGREHSLWGHDEYSPELLDARVAQVKSALAKAPRIKEPVIVYRGIKAAHITGDIGDNDAALDRSDVSTDEVRKKFVVGEIVDMGPLPTSGSLNPETAVGFSSNVVLEIKTRTLASPVNVSAWHTSEYEAFVDNSRKYRVVSVQDNVKYTCSSRYTADDIRVIQLEEVE